MEHQEVFAAQALDLRSQRTLLLGQLAALPGVHAYPSDANMILLRVPDAQKTFEAMRSRKVLVKNVSKMHLLLANCLRVTVGTVDENRLMLSALEESL